VINGVDTEFDYQRTGEKIRVEANKVYSREKVEGQPSTEQEEGKNLYMEKDYNAQLVFFDTVENTYERIYVNQISRRESSDNI